MAKDPLPRRNLLASLGSISKSSMSKLSQSAKLENGADVGSPSDIIITPMSWESRLKKGKRNAIK